MRTTYTLKKVSVGTDVSIVQEGIPEAIPPEACYLGWQESLEQLARLVEAEVPFITVFWLGHGIGSALAKKCKSAGSWDTHGNNFNCLKEDLLPEFDRAFSALVEDLAQRGLLAETLLLVTSEMGRTPKIGDRRSGGTTPRPI